MTDTYVPAFVAAYVEHAAQDPANPLSWYARADEYRDSGDVDAWRRTIETALAMPHHSPEQIWYRSWARLKLGDWAGWTDYEARALHTTDSSPRATVDDWVRWTHGAWDGVEDLTDKTILVLSEQGIGDNIQMLRFLAPLADRAKSVIARVYPRLVPFVQCNVGDRVTVIIQGVDKPFAFDRYVHIMSLPHLIGELPPFVPWRSPRRRPRLVTRSRPIRAGICWAGNPEYGNDEQRSMPAAELAPLLALPSIEWHSLQVGARAGDADRYSSLLRPWPPLMTFGDTADLISELDVVVAVDTAVAHLAGCLGARTYLLLPVSADSRWGITDDRTPWYPSLRIVRQSSPGDWAGVVLRLQDMLDPLLPSRNGVIPTGDPEPQRRVLLATH
jgi:hypothetical protein